MKKDTITIEVPDVPVSVNGALKGARRFPSKEYKAWKDIVEESVPDKIKIQKSMWYEVIREYYFPLFYKNGNVRIKDVANYIKYADDELVKHLVTYEGDKVDDCQFIHGEETKIDCKEGEEKTIWTITAIV